LLLALLVLALLFLRRRWKKGGGGGREAKAASAGAPPSAALENPLSKARTGAAALAGAHPVFFATAAAEEATAAGADWPPSST